MTVSKLASDVAENHWETKGMKQALQAEMDYNLMTTQKLERLKVQRPYSLGWKEFCAMLTNITNSYEVLAHWSWESFVRW